jgi:hypothetical protein
LPPKKPVDLLHSLAAIAANNKQEEAVMGLDMYAYTTQKALITSDVDFVLDQDLFEPLHYWRKHHNLHDWMQRLYQAKGGQDPDFNLSPVALNRADLGTLELAIKAGDLPDTGRFFFGASDGSERDNDLAFIRKGREALQRGLAVFYVAWW